MNGKIFCWFSKIYFICDNIYLCPGDGWVGVACEAAEQLAGAALLHHPRPQVEGEHRRGLLLLLVQLRTKNILYHNLKKYLDQSPYLVGVNLALADRQRLGLVARQVLGHGLHVEEDWLLRDAVVVLGVDDELAAVLHLAPVDDEGVVVPDVALHVLDALPELHVLVVPGDAAVGEGDDAAGEPGALPLQRERRLRLDHEPWRSALTVDQHLKIFLVNYQIIYLIILVI